MKKKSFKGKNFGIRLGILRFGVIHKKVGRSNRGIRIAECGINIKQMNELFSKSLSWRVIESLSSS